MTSISYYPTFSSTSNNKQQQQELKCPPTHSSMLHDSGFVIHTKLQSWQQRAKQKTPIIQDVWFTPLGGPMVTSVLKWACRTRSGLVFVNSIFLILRIIRLVRCPKSTGRARTRKEIWRVQGYYQTSQPWKFGYDWHFQNWLWGMRVRDVQGLDGSRYSKIVM